MMDPCVVYEGNVDHRELHVVTHAFPTRRSSDLADAKAAAVAAQQQALAIGLIADAAERAAAGEGGLTNETRLYLQAARAARIEAEQHAVTLAKEAGAVERLEFALGRSEEHRSELQSRTRLPYDVFCSKKKKT